MTATVRKETEALEYISSLVYERARIRLDDGKHELIKARLGKRLRHHGFAALPDYCEFLQSHASEDEVTHVIDALTTNFTNFMREPDHFEFLVRIAVPRLSGARRPVRIWSAACSSGEEPFTIACFMDDLQRSQLGMTWEITASDISTKVLAQAQTAVYTLDRIKCFSPEWVSRYFQRGMGRSQGLCRVKPALAARVAFRQINLAEDYSHTNPFDVIFCRNAMIYFDRDIQQQIVRRLSSHLVPGGYLIIGHSESLNGLDVPLRCIRPSIYQSNT
jgi:chemotaxis protein methyltransferase CheR